MKFTSIKPGEEIVGTTREAAPNPFKQDGALAPLLATNDDGEHPTVRFNLDKSDPGMNTVLNQLRAAAADHNKSVRVGFDLPPVEYPANATPEQVKAIDKARREAENAERTARVKLVPKITRNRDKS